MPDDGIDRPLADDLLFGLLAIGAFIGEQPCVTARLIRSGVIPAGRAGREYVGSKSALRRRFGELTSGYVTDRGRPPGGGEAA